MKILVGDKSNVDFGSPIPMTKTQQDKFIQFMKSLFAVVETNETEKFRLDRLGDCLFQREWTTDEIVVLLDINNNVEKAAEMLGRTWMGVDIKRGEVIPGLMKWADSKGYDLVKGDIKKILEEYLQDKKDLAKQRRSAKSAHKRKIDDMVRKYNWKQSFIESIKFRWGAGLRNSNDEDIIKKTQAEMAEIENELHENGYDLI